MKKKVSLVLISGVIAALWLGSGGRSPEVKGGSWAKIATSFSGVLLTHDEMEIVDLGVFLDRIGPEIEETMARDDQVGDLVFVALTVPASELDVRPVVWCYSRDRTPGWAVFVTWAGVSGSRRRGKFDEYNERFFDSVEVLPLGEALLRHHEGVLLPRKE